MNIIDVEHIKVRGGKDGGELSECAAPPAVSQIVLKRA